MMSGMNDTNNIDNTTLIGSTSQLDPDENKRDGMSDLQIKAYMVGHFNNDLCASMWFIYLTYYLTYVVELKSEIVALALLSGQITDGITTPIVGVLSDKLNGPCGKRNTFFIFGSLLVIPSFMGIFMDFPFVKSGSKSFENIWYCVLPAIFNIGWACVQISHLSIVNQLSYGQRRRDTMVNGRNIFTYAANIFMLITSLIFFLTIASGPLCFRLLTIVCLSCGGITTIFYVISIKETQLSALALEYDKRFKAKVTGNHVNLLNQTNIAKKESKGKTPADWLKECQFYLFGFVYMFARLALNCNATMMPFYLISVTQFNPLPGLATSPVIALVPLLTYISSLLFTLFLQKKIT